MRGQHCVRQEKKRSWVGDDSQMQLTQTDLRCWLRGHQRRLAAGDPLPPITTIAERAGLHRDTLYALLAGDRISEVSQRRLSRAVQAVEIETAGLQKTRVMAVRFGPNGPSIRFGISPTPLLRSKASP